VGAYFVTLVHAFNTIYYVLTCYQIYKGMVEVNEVFSDLQQIVRQQQADIGALSLNPVPFGTYA
jgi:hypothetical protein